MTIIEKITEKESLCKRFLGLTPNQIEVLLARLEPHWLASEKRLLERADRVRSIGGGRKYQPGAFKTMLTTCLLYYKLYLTQEFIGIILGADQSTVSRYVSRLAGLIAVAADPELETFFQRAGGLKKQRVRNFVELQQVCPELADVITDATETPCNRPKDEVDQKKFYSGKQKTHTIKTQITINSYKRIINVSDAYPGSVHDKAVLDREETIKKIPQKARHTLDKGYCGVDKEHPASNILIPFRRNRGQQKLSPMTKATNRYLSKVRMPVEHVIGKIKNFKICAIYRGRRDRFNKVFRDVAALYNFVNFA
jgi:hypothetical protein